MAREYGQMNPDGTVSVIRQNDDGTYTVLRTESYTQNQGSATNIGGGNPISAEHREGLRQAGYGDWANPNLTEADFARISAGAQAGGGPGGLNLTNAEYYNQYAVSNQIAAAQQAAQKAYWEALIRGQDERLAFDKARDAFAQALQVAQLIASLSGPANAFQQQEVLHGLNNMGISKAVGAIAGTNELPIFQAPQAQPVPLTLQSLNQMLSGATQATAQPVTPGAQPQTGQNQTMPSANGSNAGLPVWMNPDTKAYKAAAPDPNKIVGRNWLSLDPDTQQFLLSLYKSKGYSGTDVLDTIQKMLPQFKAPSVGSVR